MPTEKNSAEAIIEQIYQAIGEQGLMFLVVLKKEGPLLKERLKDEVNNVHESVYEEPLVQSKHTLNAWCYKLEGAALVNVKEYGRAREYAISELGKAMIEYAHQQKKAEK
jgi:hypothetical protein